MKNILKAMFEPLHHLLPSSSFRFTILVPLAIAKDRVRQGSQDVVEVTVPVEIMLKVVEVEDDIEFVVKPSEPKE